MASNYKFSNEEMAAIKAARRETKDKRADARLKALELRAEGMELSEVSQATGFHAAYVSQLVAKYRDHGLEAISGNHYGAQHTDYIFSSMGEELGFVGCLAIMIMEMAIIARCSYVGMHCQDSMRRLVCYGAASALMFQVMINTGMCIGVMPVIGLTLPLISYGGSSVVSIYAMLGLVSGAHARPQSLSHERYVQPYR